VELDVQSNKIKHNVNILKNEKKYIDIYNKQIQDVCMSPCFSCERFFFKNSLNV
jgi:hypothetical protein